MDELLVNYLEEFSSPEMRALLLEAAELLEKFDYENHHTPINDAIMSTDNEDSGVTINKIYSLLKNSLLDVLRQHSIHVDEEIPFSLLNRFIQFINLIETSEETSRIMDICQTDMSTEEKIAEISNVITGLPADEVLVYIENVHTKLIDAIIQLVEKNTEEDEDSDIIDSISLRNKVEQLERLYSDSKDRFVLDLIDSGMRFNLHLESYLSVSNIFNLELEPAVIARALVAFQIISIDGNVNSLERIIQIADTNIDDYTNKLKVKSMINILFIEANKKPTVVLGAQ